MSGEPSSTGAASLRAGLRRASAVLARRLRRSVRPALGEERARSAETLTRARKRRCSRRKRSRANTQADISRDFRANGSTNPEDPTYVAHAKTVSPTGSSWSAAWSKSRWLSLAELRAMPSRTQITRHDCVEGWSSIGKWTGVRLAPLLDRRRLEAERALHRLPLRRQAREDRSTRPDQYYESIDLIDAYHPQTILAYEMNDQTLPVAHGAPLTAARRATARLQEGEIRDADRSRGRDSPPSAAGNGGFWEDCGYEWYAGI